MILQNILCPKECKIVGQLLVDHALSYALTATADVPAVYLQQFWKTVRLVVNANETIRFLMDRKEITYTVDMFLSNLKLLVMLKSLLNIYDLDCGGWWVALGIASSIGL
ncbi:hypothetical protein Tco_0853691, partial [Tanacetum coccineum]